MKLIDIGDKKSITVLDAKTLDTRTKRRLEKLEEELEHHVYQFGKSGLRIGEVLTRINDLLTPTGQFVEYLAGLPWMPQATAYRFMGAYRQAEQNLPAVVLSRVLASGIPMFSYRTDKPFGRFTEAVESVGKPPADPEKADRWLNEVQLAYEKSHEGRRRLQVEELIEKAAQALVRYHKRCPKAISGDRFLKQVEEVFDAAEKKVA